MSAVDFLIAALSESTKGQAMNLNFLFSIFVLAFSFLAFASTAKAEQVFSHSGNTDPTTEGWSLILSGADNSVGAVTNDIGTGIDAWFTDDDTTGLSNVAAYTATPSASAVNAGNLNGWTLSTNLRVVDIPDAVDSSVIVLYRDGATSWEMNFGSALDGDTIVQLSSGDLHVLQNTGTGYHQFDLVYDPVNATADLFVDGLEVISDSAGIASASTPSIAWGADSTSGTGQGNFASVSFSVVPEPSSFILAVLGLTAVCRRHRNLNA